MSLMYLEDYLELVSFLPQEFRERLTKVRELDLESSNRRDNIEKLKKRLHRGRIIKSENIPAELPAEENLTANDRAGIVAEINSEYDKIVNLGVEKVRIVSGLEEMMMRYNRRLATDTEKFKMELEADNPGITESLEARAEAEMRNFYDGGAKVVSAEAARVPSSRRISDMGMIVAMQKKAMLQGSQTGGTNMLARAASQAITATQHMQHGRRTASLKASYEAVRNTPTRTSSRAGSGDRDDSSTRGDGRRGRAARGSRKAYLEEMEDVATDAQDDDKRPYCFCRQPSLGFMVACDNRRCPIEWYHGSCVGVTADDVEGKQWFCPSCTTLRNNKKKHMVKQSELKPEPGMGRAHDGASKFGKKHPRKL